MLCGGVGHLLVQFLGDFDKTTAVDLAEPCEFPQLTAQFEQGSHELLDLILVQIRDGIRRTAIPILEKPEPTVGLTKLLVIERVDIFEVAIQGEEEFCGCG